MTRLADIIHFRSDMLFQGAVDLSWFNTQREISQTASAAFVFHGPSSHSFNKNEELGIRHPTDTASFTLSTIRRACNIDETPFTFAIAGYGTGKSHLALTLAELLHDPDSTASQAILQSISTTDENIGHECTLLFKENKQPSLVITLNGMGQYSLVAELTSAFINVLKLAEQDTSPVEALRPRFERAANMLTILKDNASLVTSLCHQTGIDSLEKIIEELRHSQNENVFDNVAICLQEAGCPLEVAQLESLKDLFSCVVDNYCGQDKKYKSIVIFFDEFGKYLEFAIERSVVAGNGVLQDLFEAIQSSHGLISFTGFIQFELKAYSQRLSAALQNEASRYVTRYDSADKKYLSTNMETLIANLIEKKDIEFLSKKFDNDEAQKETGIALKKLQHYFKDVDNYAIWKNPTLFHAVLRKNCWPLSPYALWFFLSLASGSRFLQERSVLSLLDDFFRTVETLAIEDIPSQGFSPAHLFSTNLLSEFISSEKFSAQGAIAHSLDAVLIKHDVRLDNIQKLLLKSIVIAEKLGLVGSERLDVIEGLCLLCGISTKEGESALEYLQKELNVIEWDEGYKSFDIISDAVPRTQFIAFLRQRLGSEYDEEKQSKLFEKYVDILAADSLTDVDTDFGEEKKIQTSEWKYSPIKTNELFLEAQITKSVSDFINSVAPNETKGKVIYVYVTKNSDIESVKLKALKFLKEAVCKVSLKLAPIIISFFHDEDGKLGQILAEHDILENLDSKEKEQFSNLISAHREKLCFNCNNALNDLKKQKHIVSLLKYENSPKKLRIIGKDLFEKIYPRPLSFEFDGFSGSTSSNGPATAYDLAQKLIFGALDYDKIKSLKPSDKNRADKLLNFTWGIYEPSGIISQRPKKSETLSYIFKEWDKDRKEKGLSLNTMMNELLSPPFGANTYSALLAISVYISARITSSYIKKSNGDIESVSEWGETLFSSVRRKQVERTFFGNVELLLSSGESQEWEELLTEWEYCELYDELVLFPSRSNALRRKLPPSHELYDRMQYLQEKSKEAGDRKIICDELYNRAFSQLESAEKQQKFHLFIDGAANLQKLLIMFKDSPRSWLKSLQDNVENELTEVRQFIIRNLDGWVAKENPISENPEHIAKFNEHLKSIISKLKAINLIEESDKLEALRSEKIKNVEILAKYKQRIEDGKKFVQLQSIQVKSANMADLNLYVKTCDHYAKELEKIARNRDLHGLKETRSELSEFKDIVVARQKELKRQLANVMTTEITNSEAILKCLQGFEKIKHFFVGEANFQDIIDSEIFLKWLSTSIEELGNLSLLESVFEEKIEIFSHKCQEQIEENELSWEAKDILTPIIHTLRENRINKSAEWCLSLFEQTKNINELATSEVLSIKNDLQRIPPYATLSDKSFASDLLEKIDNHLETVKIEWLVQEFNSLSSDQKNKVLQMITQ